MADDTVIVGGAVVDASDPCAIAKALERVRLSVVTGGAVEVSRFGEDEVRFTKADIGRLDSLITDYRGQCQAIASPRRRQRYAMRFRF